MATVENPPPTAPMATLRVGVEVGWSMSGGLRLRGGIYSFYVGLLAHLTELGFDHH
jgi:hypothetical protein